MIMPRKWGSLRERFDRAYMPITECGCWIWMNSLAGNGYGTIKTGVKSERAHRVSWQLHKGDIPQDMHVLHRCDVPCCVNPDHLWLGTHAQNMLDRDDKGRRTPPRGSAHTLAKLNAEQVAIIYRASGKSLRQLARHFGVTKTLIYLIRSGKHRSRETFGLKRGQNV